MKSLIQRILLFVIAIPLLIIIIKIPYKNHFAVNILATILSSLGALEFQRMLKKQGFRISAVEAVALGGLCPLAMTLNVSLEVPVALVPYFFLGGTMWTLTSKVLSSKEQLRDTLSYMIGGFAVLIYPGMFMLWIIRMSLFPRADLIIMVFVFMVIANDSTAWAAGMLFGRGNRGIIPASPNKSLAGFIGGIAASSLVGVLAALFLSKTLGIPGKNRVFQGFILGFGSGIATILGDLAESLMKRSADIKDSGSIVPGRGGILDSIDSIAFTAPVFCALFRIFFH